MFTRLLLLLIPLLFIACKEKPQPKNKPIPQRAPVVQTVTTDLDSETRIVLGMEAAMFPSHWLGGDIKAKAEPLSKSEKARSQRIVKRALGKYPADVLRNNLKNVYVVGDLSFLGISASGSYSKDAIYVVNKGTNTAYTDRYIEETIHHEFSSILFNNYEFPEEEWKACNPENFTYLSTSEGGVLAVQQGKDSLKGTPELYHKGFLSEYSMSELEEDLNVFSERVMYDPRRFRIFMEIYPEIEKKFKIWIKFYNKIDPYFTEESLFKDYRSGSRKDGPSTPTAKRNRK